MKSTCPFLFLFTLGLTTLGAERFRTDINHALCYYQAFAAAPKLSDADHHYLFNTEWRGQRLEGRFGEWISKYDGPFKLLRQAAEAQTACDWGIGLAEGTMALLPGLAPAKNVAHAARLRVLWHLQNGQQAEARDDLLASFTLARNLAKDGVLVSALVQFAMENILLSSVAENFFQFSPETLEQLVAGFDAAPARATIAQCVAMEKAGFYDWLLRKIDELQKENPGNEKKVIEGIRALLGGLAGEEGGAASDLPERVIESAGGTTAGVLKLVRELEPLYEQASSILRLPYAEFGLRIRAFNAEVENHPNPLVPEFFKVYDKCRQKEFACEITLAMVRAAVKHKLEGETGVKSVMDPGSNGPFTLERFSFEGLDRGFKLKSPFRGRGFDEVLIFVEKGGPPFQVIGKNAGKAPSNGPGN